MTRETDLDDLVRAHAAGGAAVVDVRDPAEYVGGHVPGAVNIPLPQLADRLGEVPTGGRVLVVCASGNRSKAGTDVLRRAGRDAVSVRGGTAAWAKGGHALTAGPRP